ncbi:MAG: ABC transporter permease [Deltaproteobacteria bacterium]|jgi:NitT/TauT family transport system permease protein|nr:ABC transporter permease [Deltaproteobacteria bacterium]
MARHVSIPAFLVLWETLSRSGAIRAVFFPPFSQVMATLAELAVSGELWGHLSISLLRALSGFALAALAGLPLGFVLGGHSRSLFELLDLPMEILSQLNPFLLFHLVILVMGIGEAPKITMVAWTCLWPIAFGAMSGARGVNPELVRAGRAFGLSGVSILSRIRLPAAGRQIFQGLRLALGQSLFMLVAAEMMGASRGLGFLVLDSQETFQLRKMYAAVLAIAFLGLALDALFGLLSRLLVPLPPGQSANTAGD